MEYYFLKGIEKAGPYSIEELSKEEINDETLFWYEGLNNWKKLKELPELRKYIFIEDVSPPPIPTEIMEKAKKEKGLEIKDEKKRKSRKAIKWFLSLIVLTVSVLISNSLAENHKNEKKDDLLEKIELIFQGKTAVCDGEKYEVEGDLNSLKNPRKSVSGNAATLDEYNKKKEKGVVEEFTLTDGGFSIYEIIKEDNGYVVTFTQATNMEYLVGKYEYYTDYKLPSNRPSITECYTGAYNYLTIENKEGCYTPYVYSKIANFSFLSNEFFEIRNIDKPSDPFSNHWWQDDSGSIYTSQYSVSLKSDSRYYEIEENGSAKELFLNYIGFGVLVGGLIIGLIIWIMKTYE